MIFEIKAVGVSYYTWAKLGGFLRKVKVGAIPSSYCTDPLEACGKKTNDNDADAKATSSYVEQINAIRNVQGPHISFTPTQYTRIPAYQEGIDVAYAFYL